MFTVRFGFKCRVKICLLLEIGLDSNVRVRVWVSFVVKDMSG